MEKIKVSQEREREREQAQCNLKQNYIDKIKNLPSVSFNKDQKDLAIEIINNCSIDNVENIYKLISARIKTGFVFDSAPANNNQSISYLKYNEKLSFNLDLFDKQNKSNFDTQTKLTNHNMLILGENYDALNNLLLTHRNKVDVIYIDPPYNTDASINEKNNLSEIEINEKSSTKFVYRDKFSRTGWLNMMQDRLIKARDLLKEDGVIFVSIDDSEQAYLKVLMDDIFGENNFLMNFVKKTNSGINMSKHNTQVQHEYLLCYCNEINLVKLKGEEKEFDNYKNPDNDINGEWIPDNPSTGIKPLKQTWEIVNPFTNQKEIPPKGRQWIFTKEKFDLMVKNGKIIFKKEHKEGERSFILKRYKKDVKNTFSNVSSIDFIDNRYMSINGTKEIINIMGDKIFDNPKPLDFVKKILKIINNKNAIVLDFFAGSGTTGQAVMELNKEDGGNRKFILVTNNAKIGDSNKQIGLDICYERLYRVVFGKGSKNEQIEWKYNDKEKSLVDNSLLVFDIGYCDVSINTKEFDNAYNNIKKSFRLIDENFDINDDSLIKKLYALHPLEKEKDDDKQQANEGNQ